jgi:hypothetical protein
LANKQIGLYIPMLCPQANKHGNLHQVHDIDGLLTGVSGQVECKNSIKVGATSTSVANQIGSEKTVCQTLIEPLECAPF